MNYYTSTIPLPLAEKLKEKGMPMNLWEGVGKYIEQLEDTVEMRGGFYFGIFNNTILYQLPTYAEVFDWLMEKGIYISICHRETSVGIEWYPMVNGKCPRAIDGRERCHSANVAIEKALTLI